ncbi:MAG: dienelactone hydrolase family protein [Chloroflexota bacterium]
MNRIELMETVREYQVGTISRRQFLTKSTAVLGSLAAANTLLAACNAFPNEDPPPVVDAAGDTAVTTTQADLTSQIVTYPGAEQELMGYLTYQTGDTPRPVIIVIQEWWGLNDHIKDIADRFAKEGYVALAPDLYHGVVTTEPDEARKQVMELGMRDAVGELQSAIDYLKGQDFVNGRFGATGYCMGGGLVFELAATSPDLLAAIPYYGTPVSEDEAQNISAPVLSFLGTNDGIPAQIYEAVHAVLDENGVENKFQLYDGARHAFFNDTRPSYDETSATDSWDQSLAWFESHLAS